METREKINVLNSEKHGLFRNKKLRSAMQIKKSSVDTLLQNKVYQQMVASKLQKKSSTEIPELLSIYRWGNNRKAQQAIKCIRENIPEQRDYAERLLKVREHQASVSDNHVREHVSPTW